MKHLIPLFTLSFFLISSLAFCQLDKTTGATKEKGKKIVLLKKVNAKELKKPIGLDFKDDTGFKNALKKQKEAQAKKKKQQEQDNKGIITKEMIAFQNFKKNIEGNYQNFPLVDMDLGSFHTKSEYVYISSYDFGRFDGDKVQISVNGKVQIASMMLLHKIKTVKIPLEEGINKIEVLAINEGDLSPNTGFFAFVDQNKQVIKKDQWMLAKGAKVIAVVVRDKQEKAQKKKKKETKKVQ